MSTLIKWVIVVVLIALGVFLGLFLWAMWGESLLRRARGLLQAKQKPVSVPPRHPQPAKQDLRPLPTSRESRGTLAIRRY